MSNIESNVSEGWSDAQKTNHIRKTVYQAGQDLRAKHPWLKHQNTIAVVIMIFSLGGMIARTGSVFKIVELTKESFFKTTSS